MLNSLTSSIGHAGSKIGEPDLSSSVSLFFGELRRKCKYVFFFAYDRV